MISISPRNLRIPYIGAGPLLAAIVLAAAIFAGVWPWLHGADVFPDPVASNLAWNHLWKGGDYLVIVGGLGLVVVLSALIACLCSWIAGDREEISSRLNELLLLSILPVVWRLAVAYSIGAREFAPLAMLGFFPLIAVIAMLLMARHRRSLDADRVLHIGGAIGLGALLSGFAGLAVLTALSRLVPAAAVHLQDGMAIVPLLAIVVFLFACIVVTNGNCPDATAAQSRLLRLMQYAQAPLPLFFFYLMPPVMVDPTHQFANVYPARLAVTLAVLALGAWLAMWRRFHRAGSFNASLSPICLSLLVMFVWCDPRGLPVAERDYFHWGEQLLPWQQVWDFHLRPYVDFVPVHGLMPMTRGAFNQFFFDGTLASYGPSDFLLFGSAVLATGLGVSYLVGPIGVFLLLLGWVPYLDRMYFFVPALLLMAGEKLLNRPARWLLTWLIVSVLMIAYNPTIGPAFALGTFPLALWISFRLWRQSKPQLLAIVLLVLLAGGLAWIIRPMREVLLGFMAFMSQNAWTNEVAHGIGWEEEYGKRIVRDGIGTSQFLFELVRCGWAPVTLAAMGMLWAELSRRREDRRPSVLALTVSVPPAMLLTVPWILGRIDGVSISKTGSLMYAAVFTLLPTLLLLQAPRKKLVGLLLLAAGIIGYCYPRNPPFLDPNLLLSYATRIRPVPIDAKMADGAVIGMPRLGQVIQPTPNFLDDLVTLKKDLNEFLRPGESFTDLTNQGAVYYYLNLPCPTRYAPFVAANSRLQSGELQQLHDHPQPVVLIWPAGWIDDIPVPMRCYEVYREYVQKFVAVQRDQYIFLVDPSRLEHPPVIGSPEQIELIEPWLSKTNLLRLPLSWGESWSPMRNRFDPVAPVAVSAPVFRGGVELRDGKMFFAGTSPYWEYNIPRAVKDGATADFLRIQYEDEPANPADRQFAESQPPLGPGTGAEPAMTCRWIGSDGRDSEAISFKAGKGNLILPLGAYPRWLLGKAPLRLRFDFQNPDCVKWIRITQAEFLHLKMLPTD